MTQTRSTPKPEIACDAEPPARGYAVERSAPRMSGSLVPGIRRVRLMPLGIEGSIVNIGATGTLILCASKLGAGMPIRVEFEGTQVPSSVTGEIVRSLVSSIDQRGQLWYHVGIAFDEPIDVDPALTTAERADSDGEELLAHSRAPAKFVNRW